MNILFICSANKDRSKTAEDYFSEQYPEISFDSAGTNKTTCNQLGTNFIEKHQLEDADIIYVMETKHLRAIKKLFGNDYTRKINVLNIQDYYTYYEPELIEVLSNSINF